MTPHTSGPRLLDVHGQTVAVVTGGPDRSTHGADDVPIVFLHGILAAPDVWLPTLPRQVRDERRWHSLSLPGHARGGPPADFRRETFTQILADAIRQLAGSEKVALVGWSTGGFAALDLAARFPELVASVMSIAGFAKGRWHGSLGALQRAARRGRLGRLLCQGVLRLLAASPRLHLAALRRQMHVSRRRGSQPAFDETLGRLHAALGHHDLALLAAWMGRIRSFDISAALPAISVPALIVGGTHDPIVPVFHTRALSAAIPAAKLALIPDCGHFLFLENTSRYQQLLGDWLAPPSRPAEEHDVPSVAAESPLAALCGG